MKRGSRFSELLRKAVGEENPARKEAYYQLMIYDEFRHVLEEYEQEGKDAQGIKKEWCDIMETSTDPQELIETSAKLENKLLPEDVAQALAKINKGN